MKLTNRQIDHITARIECACNEACAKELKALGPEVEEPELTEAQKRAQIENGTAKLKKNVTRYMHVWDAFIFEHDKKKVEAHRAWTRKSDAVRNKWHLKRQALIDKLLLSGNADEALKLLQDVDAGKF